MVDSVVEFGSIFSSILQIDNEGGNVVLKWDSGEFKTIRTVITLVVWVISSLMLREIAYAAAYKYLDNDKRNNLICLQERQIAPGIQYVPHGWYSSAIATVVVLILVSRQIMTFGAVGETERRTETARALFVGGGYPFSSEGTPVSSDRSDLLDSARAQFECGVISNQTHHPLPITKSKLVRQEDGSQSIFQLQSVCNSTDNFILKTSGLQNPVCEPEIQDVKCLAENGLVLNSKYASSDVGHRSTVYDMQHVLGGQSCNTTEVVNSKMLFICVLEQKKLVSTKKNICGLFLFSNISTTELASEYRNGTSLGEVLLLSKLDSKSIDGNISQSPPCSSFIPSITLNGFNIGDDVFIGPRMSFSRLVSFVQYRQSILNSALTNFFTTYDHFDQVWFDNTGVVGSPRGDILLSNGCLNESSPNISLLFGETVDRNYLCYSDTLVEFYTEKLVNRTAIYIPFFVGLGIYSFLNIFVALSFMYLKVRRNPTINISYNELSKSFDEDKFKILKSSKEESHSYIKHVTGQNGQKEYVIFKQ